MAISRWPDASDSEGFGWYDPLDRGILPLDDFHVPRRLRRVIRSQAFEIRIDTRFTEIIELCAEATDDRPQTWINRQIVDLYSSLFDLGHGHSVECWQGEELVGGLYGVSLRGAFFGESMFSKVTNASKVALVYLVAILRHSGFVLLDTQFMTDHLRQFGGIEILKPDYKRRLAAALGVQPTWQGDDPEGAVAALLAGEI